VKTCKNLPLSGKDVKPFSCNKWDDQGTLYRADEDNSAENQKKNLPGVLCLGGGFSILAEEICNGAELEPVTR
jgi:hypothetical protein